MDLTTNRTINITQLALSGLEERQQAITANTANVISPNYSRKEVSFESQLQEMISRDDLKEYIKGRNSMEFNPTALDIAMGRTKPELTIQEKKFLQSNVYKHYAPQIFDDTVSGYDAQGNNVELEREVMDLASTGLKYQTLSKLENKQFRIMSSAIKGDLTSL
ncbi:MAG: flagellar basal body rod protein FlgB [bacterium]|nr:flagellar basal body rod protein FlgB [bacterium]